MNQENELTLCSTEWLNNMNSSLVIRNERSVHQSRYRNGGGILTAQLKMIILNKETLQII